MYYYMQKIESWAQKKSSAIFMVTLLAFILAIVGIWSSITPKPVLAPQGEQTEVVSNVTTKVVVNLSPRVEERQFSPPPSSVVVTNEAELALLIARTKPGSTNGIR